MLSFCYHSSCKIAHVVSHDSYKGQAKFTAVQQFTMRKHFTFETNFYLAIDHWNSTFIIKIKTYLCDLRRNRIRVFHLSYDHLFWNHGIHVHCHISCDRLSFLRCHRICALCGNHLCVLCDGIRLFWNLFCVLSYDHVFHLLSLFSIHDVRPILLLHRVRLFYGLFPVNIQIKMRFFYHPFCTVVNVGSSRKNILFHVKYLIEMM